MQKISTDILHNIGLYEAYSEKVLQDANIDADLLATKSPEEIAKTLIEAGLYDKLQLHNARIV